MALQQVLDAERADRVQVAKLYVRCKCGHLQVAKNGRHAEFLLIHASRFACSVCGQKAMETSNGSNCNASRCDSGTNP